MLDTPSSHEGHANNDDKSSGNLGSLTSISYPRNDTIKPKPELDKPHAGRSAAFSDESLMRVFNDPTGRATAALAILVTIVMSAGMINFNKILLGPSLFPHAVALVTLHALLIPMFTGVLLLLKPTLFPALTHPEQKIQLDRKFVFTGLVPVAFLYAMCLACGNMAFLYLSVSLLQMIKKSNVLFSYGFSLVFGLEKFQWNAVFVLVCIAACTATMIADNVHKFGAAGVLFCLSGVAFDALKVVLQTKLVRGQNIDVLSYILLITPISFVFLACILVVGTLSGSSSLLVCPPLEVFLRCWKLLLLNVCLAFCMNVCVVFCSKTLMPTTYSLAAVIKDIMIISCGCLFMGDVLSPGQKAAICVLLVCLWAWHELRRSPKVFEEHGLLMGIWLGSLETLNALVPSTHGKSSRCPDNDEQASIYKFREQLYSTENGV